MFYENYREEQKTFLLICQLKIFQPIKSKHLENLENGIFLFNDYKKEDKMNDKITIFWFFEFFFSFHILPTVFSSY